MSTRNANSFNTFLQVLEESQANIADPPPTRRVLEPLQLSPRRSVRDLWQATGLGFDDYARALRHVQDKGLVAVESNAGEEIVELTPEGRLMLTLQ